MVMLVHSQVLNSSRRDNIVAASDRTSVYNMRLYSFDKIICLVHEFESLLL